MNNNEDNVNWDKNNITNNNNNNNSNNEEKNKWHSTDVKLITGKCLM